MKTLQKLFSQPIYKGNLHSHSTCSDGQKTPEQIIRYYQRYGYDFVSVTDHFMLDQQTSVTDTRHLRSTEFTTLIGAELHPPKTRLGLNWHLLAVGLPAGFAPIGTQETAEQLLERAATTGAFLGVAHPQWYGLEDDEITALPHIKAIEVFNTTARYHNDRADSWGVVDRLMNQGRRYFALAVDDTHWQPQRPDARGGWVHVSAPHLDPEALLESLHGGLFYASQGPTINNIHYHATRHTIAIDCSPVREVYIAGRGYRTRFKMVKKGSFTQAELPLADFEDGGFFRITLINAKGQRAWTNHCYL